MRNKTALWFGGASLATLLCSGIYLFVLVPQKPSSLSNILADNGFVALQPPSNLYQPGMLVEIRQEDPLQLGIVCRSEDSLGLVDDSAVETSESSSIAFGSQLHSQFAVDVGSMTALTSSTEMAGLQSVSYDLSNVFLVEIPDTSVIEGLEKRTEACKKAIRLRRENNKPITMIKSVLVADVTYHVAFGKDIAAAAKSTLLTKLALGLDAKINASQSNELSMSGAQLVWGIRDDKLLARAGQNLPPTGGTEQNRSILSGKGPITQTYSETNSGRRVFQELKTLVSHNLLPIKQTTTMGCWAAVYTMMRSWHDKEKWTVAQAVESLGGDYTRFYVRDTGLPGGTERQFVRDAGLIAVPPASYPLTTFIGMLRQYGPLWITSGDGLNAHAYLLIGVYGKSMIEDAKSYQDAKFELIDPKEGKYYYLSANQFMEEFEREAVIIVSGGSEVLEFRWQILHWPES